MKYGASKGFLAKKPRPPRAKRVRPAAEAIHEFLVEKKLAEPLRLEGIATEWKELAGERVSARTRPLDVKDRVLIIEVATSAWLHELNLLRAHLAAKLVAAVGEPRLFDELKLVLAGRSRRPSLPPRPQRPPPPPPLPPPVPARGAARDQILKDVERVDDLELRELIARVRIDNDR